MTASNEWKTMTFRDDGDQPPATHPARADFIRQRAKERFGLTDADFNPANVPSHPGTMPMRNVSDGGTDTLNVYELQISKAAAERLAFQYHPEIMVIADVVDRPHFPLGARDPRELRQGPDRYKKGGPKIKW